MPVKFDTGNFYENLPKQTKPD